jgi:hypothetical protein
LLSVLMQKLTRTPTTTTKRPSGQRPHSLLNLPLFRFQRTHVAGTPHRRPVMFVPLPLVWSHSSDRGLLAPGFRCFQRRTANLAALPRSCKSEAPLAPPGSWWRAEGDALIDALDSLSTPHQHCVRE